MKDLQSRLLIAGIGIPLLILLIITGGMWFTGIIVIISAVSLWEFYSLCRHKGMEPFAGLGVITGIIFQLAFWYFLSSNALFEFLLVALILIISYIILLLTFQILSKRHGPITLLGATLLGNFYITGLFSCLIAIRNFDSILNTIDRQAASFLILHMNRTDYILMMNSNHWGYFVLCVFIAVWLCDTAAYFIGKNFGKHKLAPRISPKKTIEGFIAGIAGSIIGFAVSAWITIPFIHVFEYSILIGIIIGLAGQVGDLAESQFKRDAQVKDSGRTLLGHGGFLDRFDSILFVFPAILIYFMLKLFL
ncbi:MAG: phosphatidate cytidylyltransferase [Ignavibacteria bacterium]|nr:phosphatidate cytidylyltransferase [Ignavibacteria bacterium]